MEDITILTTLPCLFQAKLPIWPQMATCRVTSLATTKTVTRSGNQISHISHTDMPSFHHWHFLHVLHTAPNKLIILPKCNYRTDVKTLNLTLETCNLIQTMNKVIQFHQRVTKNYNRNYQSRSVMTEKLYMIGMIYILLMIFLVYREFHAENTHNII